MNIIKYIFPENYSCLICDRDVFNNPYCICKNCFDALPFMTERVCLHCGDPLVSDGDYCKRCKGKKFIFDRAFAPFIYKNEIRSLIFDLKYNNKKYIAKYLAKFMADIIIKNKIYVDTIIPVPLCDKRLKSRGYNQSELLAKEISNMLNISLNTESLKRVKETPTQTKLDFIDRQMNMKDAFKVYKPKLIKDKAVLLIDDIYTTGATILECSKVLRKAGVKAIYCLTCAHTILTDDKKM